MAEKKKMSVAEILAAARKTDGGSTAAASAAPVEKSVEGSSEAPTSPQPAAPASAAGSSGKAPAASVKPATAKTSASGRPSVAEILAAARANAGKSAPAAAAVAEAPLPKEEPQSKPAAVAKAAAAKAAAAKAEPKPKPAAKAAEVTTGGPKDTASILVAARKTARPGPISKEQAAIKAAPVAPKQPAEALPAKKEKGAAVPPMPAKPSYAKKPTAKGAAEENRRGFLSVMFGTFLGLGMTALAATGALWSLGFARFMFPNILTEPPSKFKVGPPDAFPPGNVETKFVAQFGVWVVRAEYQGQSQLYALKTVCTHLGCTPNWLEAEQKFKCPCHGSGFYKDGINFEGPAPRPLERYAVRLADDGQIEIDKSKVFQEEMGQWADPASFVPV